MGEPLFKEFLAGIKTNVLETLVLEIGIHGILSRFEDWLDIKGYLKN